MNMSRSITTFCWSVCALLLLTPCFIVIADDAKEWRVSPRKAKIKNPIPVDETSIAMGKAIYIQECQNCHGKEGKGDGPEAKDLDKPIRDFFASKIWDQTDGALYTKIRTGRRPMPSFKDLLSKAEIWHVTNYMRHTYAKKTKKTKKTKK